MKKFAEFITESTQPAGRKLNLEQIYGELRRVGIHAGNRLSESPLTASRGLMALSTAIARVSQVLQNHGLVVQRPLAVDRPSPEFVNSRYAISDVSDDQLTIGTLSLTGELNPENKGTLQFHANLDVPHKYLF